MNEAELISIGDIVPPAAPVGLSSGLNTITMAVSLLLIALFLVFFIRSNQWRLLQLKLSNRKNKFSNKVIASLLIEVLHNKLNVPRISPTIFPGELNSKQQASWQVFSKQLQAARYSSDGSSQEDLENLIQRAKQWV